MTLFKYIRNERSENNLDKLEIGPIIFSSTFSFVKYYNSSLVSITSSVVYVTRINSVVSLN